jgi:di/tricarboxylate transporter
VERAVSAAALSLAGLLLVILASLTSRINVGVLAVAVAWPIALYSAGWKVEALMATFPSSLFLTLLGVTLLFGAAQANGTMHLVAARAVRLCRGRVVLLPWIFFSLACGLSTLGPGAIAATALVAPLALTIGETAGISATLGVLMVANGANAGNLSPIAAGGVLVNSLMATAGVGGHEWLVWGANFSAHLIAGCAAFLLFGGLRLSWHAVAAAAREALAPLERKHWITLGVVHLWIFGVVLAKMPPGPSAFAAAALLILLGTVDDTAAVSAVPWNVLLTLAGVSVLIGVLEKTGGMGLFTTMLARISTPGTVNGAIAFTTGLISSYSSTIGVVYPAFLPSVPGLVAKLGGGSVLQVMLSINVGAALVDVSPLSTIGALGVAAVPASQDARAVFRRLLLWGYAMSVVGALFALFVIPVLAP